MFVLIIIALISMLLNAFLNIARLLDEYSGYIDSAYKFTFIKTQIIISVIGLLSITIWIVQTR